jgi:hypothetical protein
MLLGRTSQSSFPPGTLRLTSAESELDRPAAVRSEWLGPSGSALSRKTQPCMPCDFRLGPCGSPLRLSLYCTTRTLYSTAVLYKGTRHTERTLVLQFGRRAPRLLSPRRPCRLSPPRCCELPRPPPFGMLPSSSSSILATDRQRAAACCSRPVAPLCPQAAVPGLWPSRSVYWQPQGLL